MCRPAESFSAALVGGPLTVRLETEVPGEYPAERFDALVPAIQSASPWQGHAGVVGKSLTWSARADSNTSSLQVLVVASERQDPDPGRRTARRHRRSVVRWESSAE